MAADDLTDQTGPADRPLAQPAELPRSTVLRPHGDDGGGCEACGSPHARTWSTADGPARLCPPCATLHGLGCP
jgi:hypothetical protein